MRIVRKEEVIRYKVTPLQRQNPLTLVTLLTFDQRVTATYAAVLSCFLRIRGSFLPSTTARLIVTSAISSRLGTSYMMSSIMRSSIERSARAPVPLVTACAARARNASLVTDRRTPSIEKSFVYCLSIAFFLSV